MGVFVTSDVLPSVGAGHASICFLGSFTVQLTLPVLDTHRGNDYISYDDKICSTLPG